MSYYIELVYNTMSLSQYFFCNKTSVEIEVLNHIF